MSLDSDSSQIKTNCNETEFYYLQQSYSVEGVHEYHLQSFPSICATGATLHSDKQTCSMLIFSHDNKYNTIRQCFYYLQLL